MRNADMQTTLAGVKVATRTYVFNVFKLRPDFVFSGRDFLSYYNKFMKFDPKYAVFRRKLLSPVFFARNPRAKQFPLPFHPSDIEPSRIFYPIQKNS